MLKSSFTNDLVEAGCDEAGRGCLAGPVFAAAVILPKDIQLEGLDDSKKLNEQKRNDLRILVEDQAIAWSVKMISPEMIDKINILNASFLAMEKAVQKLAVKPEMILIDGNRFKTGMKIPFECIVKGDSKYQSIAAASILAKTYRDDFMKKAHLKYPEYNWQRNKGYPTIQHKMAIRDHGLTPLHRKTFNFRLQLKLDI